jgi:hypothetical protein
LLFLAVSIRSLGRRVAKIWEIARGSRLFPQTIFLCHEDWQSLHIKGERGEGRREESCGERGGGRRGESDGGERGREGEAGQGKFSEAGRGKQAERA